MLKDKQQNSLLAHGLRKKMEAGQSGSQTPTASGTIKNQTGKSWEQYGNREAVSGANGSALGQIAEGAGINMFDQRKLEESAAGANLPTVRRSEMTGHAGEQPYKPPLSSHTTGKNYPQGRPGDNRPSNQDFHPQQRQTQNSSKGSAQDSGVPSRFTKDSASNVTPRLRGAGGESSYENLNARQSKGYQIKTTKFSNTNAKQNGPSSKQKGRKHMSLGGKKYSVRAANGNIVYDEGLNAKLIDQQLDVGLPYGNAQMGQNIQRMNHWYNDRKQSQSPGESITASVEYGRMLQHYQQHMGTEEDQMKFLSEVSRHGYPISGSNSNKKRRQLPKIPKTIGPLINVHQHFNQPTITNYNHNQYFLDPAENSQNTLTNKNTTARSRGGAKSMDEEKIAPVSAQTSQNNHHTISNASDSNLLNQSVAKTVDVRQGPLPGIREQAINLEEGNFADHQGSDSNKIDFAIQNQARQLNQQYIKQSLQRPDRYPFKSKRFKLESIRAAYNQYSLDAGSTKNRLVDPYAAAVARKHSKKRIEASVRAIGLEHELRQREDLQDQLFLVKNRLNTTNLELTKIKTRYAILQEHLKGKEKFIDDMLRKAPISSHFDPNGYSTNGSPVKYDGLGGYSSGEGSVDRLIAKGPYSILKLKKKVQDYKELLAFKAAENEELMANVRSLKVVELQKQLRIQDKQMSRLRNIAQRAISVTRKNGLEDEMMNNMDSEDYAVAFAKLSSSQRNLHEHIVNTAGNKDEDSISPPFHSFSGKTSVTHYADPNGSSEDQILQLKQTAAKLSKEKGDLQASNRDQAKTIARLDNTIKTLKSQLAEAPKKVAEPNTPSQVKQLKEQLNQLMAEKSRMNKQLTEEKAANAELRKQAGNNTRGSGRNPNTTATAQSDQDKIALSQAKNEIKYLKSQLNNKQSELHSKVKEVKDESAKNIEKMKKEHDKDKKALKDQNSKLVKEIEELKKQLKQKDVAIEEAKKQQQQLISQHDVTFSRAQLGSVQHLDATGLSKGGYEADKLQTQEAPQNQGSLQKPDQLFNRQLPSDSYVSNGEPMKELLSVKDLSEERSEANFSQLPSQVAGVSKSQISAENGSVVHFGGGISDRRRSASKNIDQGDTIKEEDENEDGDNKSQEPLEVALAARQGVSASEVPITGQKLSVRGRQNTLLKHLDNVPDESELDSQLSKNVPRKLADLKEAKFVAFEDPAVQLGFERLGRLLQLLQKPLDQIENVVLEGKFTQDQNIKIFQLQEILQNKLALSSDQAFQFARFLVEEQEEEEHGAETIVLDPNRQINSQYIPIRLMTFFNYYPKLYANEEFQESKRQFEKAFDRRAQGHFVKEIMTQEDSIVCFARFKKLIQKHVTDIKQLQPKDIDCVYLILLKGGQDDFSQYSEAQLADKVKGFDTEKISMLFADIDIDDVTSIDQPISSNLKNQKPIDQEQAMKIEANGISINETHQSIQKPIEQKNVGDGEYSDDRSSNGFDKQESMIPINSRQQNDQLPEVKSSKGFELKEPKNQSEEHAQKENLPSQGLEPNLENDLNAANLDDPNKNKTAHFNTEAEKDQLRGQESLVSQNIDVQKGSQNLEESIRTSLNNTNGEMMAQQNEDLKDKKKTVGFISERSKDPSLPANSGRESLINAKDSINEKISEKSKQKENDKEKDSENYSDGFVQDEYEEPNFGGDNKEEEKDIDKVKLEVTAPKLEQDKSSQDIDKGPSSENQEEDKQEKDEKNEQKELINEQQEPPKEQKQEEIKQDDNQNEEYGDEYYDEEDYGDEKGDGVKSVNKSRASSSAKRSFKSRKLKSENKDDGKNDEKEKEEQPPQSENKEKSEQSKKEEDEQSGQPEKEDEKQDEKQEEEKQEEEPAEEEKAKEDNEQQKEVTVEQADESKDNDEDDDDGESDGEGEELRKHIEVVLERKIAEDNLQGKLTVKNRDNLIVATVEVFEKFAESIKAKYPEMVDTCRSIFSDIIYTDVKVKENSEKERQANKKSKDKLIEKIEVEVMYSPELLSKMETVIQASDPKFKLSTGQQGCINLVFASELRDNLILYDDIESTLKTRGIFDAKLQNSSMNYQNIDKKSIRIINRMIHWLGSSNTSFSDFIGDMIQMHEVKTKAGSTNVEIIHSKKFFGKLAENGIKKSPNIHPNLCYFLCIDPKYKNYLLLKKLKRVIIDFNQSKYFQSIGLKKNKLTPEGGGDGEGDYEYYDEEDPAKSSAQYSRSVRSARRMDDSKTSFKGASLPLLNNDFSAPSKASLQPPPSTKLPETLPSNKKLLDQNQTYSIKQKSDKDVRSLRSGKSGRSRRSRVPGQSSKQATEYEYYDEEDEGAEENGLQNGGPTGQPARPYSPTFGQAQPRQGPYESQAEKSAALTAQGPSAGGGLPTLTQNKGATLAGGAALAAPAQQEDQEGDYEYYDEEDDPGQ